MAWEVRWALLLGFATSAIVQAWVPRERVQAALSGSGPPPVALATALGAASSSCSYAAIAVAKSLFQKDASTASALAFVFADLIVLPIIAIYRKYHRTRFALRITALMFVAIAIAGPLVDGLFSALGAIPTGARPTRADI